MTMARCDRCDAPILWVQPSRWCGRWLALDAAPTPDGAWVKLEEPPTGALEYAEPNVQAALVGLTPEIVAGMRHQSHSLTCDFRGMRPVGEVLGRAVPR